MILAARGGNRELRLFDQSGFIPAPGTPDAMIGGLLRSPEIAVPAVAAAVRLIAETIACFVLRVYEGDAEERRRVLDAPQATVFQEPTNDDSWSSFDLWEDTLTALELEKHAFLWKTKTKAGVEELYPIDPECCGVLWRDGRKRIEARIEGSRKDVTDKVIHIRAWAPRAGALEGVSTLDLHRRAFKTALAYDEYRGRYLDNDGSPGILLEHPGEPTKEQRRDLLDGWMRRHQGPRNVNRPGMIWGGIKFHQINSTLKDAQAVELSDAIVKDVARAFRIYPTALLHAAVSSIAGQTSLDLTSGIFWRFSLMPRLRRIERAIAADRDLFPDRRRYPRFDPSDFLRADPEKAAKVAHMLVQVGLITKNEGRATLGMPPIAGGDVLLVTPVGAAPNETDPEVDLDEDDLALLAAAGDQDN